MFVETIKNWGELMQEFQILNLDKMQNIVSSIPIHKLVFWIGAGIDNGYMIQKRGISLLQKSFGNLL
ncbi:MAG: hypothetical protein J6I97_07400 [Agathobacter sp.]|nr:hypothetical protein [Agathobacter sp.]